MVDTRRSLLPLWVRKNTAILVGNLWILWACKFQCTVDTQISAPWCAPGAFTTKICKITPKIFYSVEICRERSEREFFLIV